MSKYSRFYVGTLAVLLSYNAYGAGFVCDSIKQYDSCDTGYYLYGTNGLGSVNPGNECKTCPDLQAFCPGGVNGPLYQTKFGVQNNEGVVLRDTLMIGEKSDGSLYWCDATLDDHIAIEDCVEAGGNSFESGIASDFIPTRPQYAFRGWANSDDLSTLLFDSRGKIANQEEVSSRLGTMQLVAIWERTSCNANEYLENAACKPCPTEFPNSDGSGGINTCYVDVQPGKYVYGFAQSGKGQEDCPAGHYCEGGMRAYYNDQEIGATQCPENYRNGGTGYTSITQCVATVQGGYRIETENSAPAVCASGTWSLEHSVTYGQTSTCESCGTLDGVAASSKEPRNSKTSCYIAPNQGTKDDRGNYTFTQDCVWTE